MTEHHLRITPTGSGFWLVSNGRTWFLDGKMFHDLHEAVHHVTWYGTEWRNYEEPKREAIVVTRAAKPTLNDVLDML